MRFYSLAAEHDANEQWLSHRCIDKPEIENDVQEARKPTRSEKAAMVSVHATPRNSRWDDKITQKLCMRIEHCRNR